MPTEYTQRDRYRGFYSDLYLPRGKLHLSPHFCQFPVWFRSTRQAIRLLQWKRSEASGKHRVNVHINTYSHNHGRLFECKYSDRSQAVLMQWDAISSLYRAWGLLTKNNVPSVSLLWQGIWASVLVLSGTFDQLTI
jgi:hypothetical protein